MKSRDKFLKGLGSATFIGFLLTIVANFINLGVEYSYFQPGSSNEIPSNTSNKHASEHVLTDTVVHAPQLVKGAGNTKMNNDRKREVQLVSDKFFSSEHSWYIRVFGFIIAVFPFFYGPLDNLMNEMIYSLKIVGERMGTGVIGQILFITLIYYAIYLPIYFTLLYFLIQVFPIETITYALLICEHFINVVLSWITF